MTFRSTIGRHLDSQATSPSLEGRNRGRIAESFPSSTDWVERVLALSMRLSEQSLLSPTVAAAFARTIQGVVLRDGDPEYDNGRRVFNAMIDRRPAVIVRPNGVDDIRRAVLFA